jgi:hypothetical protein
MVDPTPPNNSSPGDDTPANDTPNDGAPPAEHEEAVNVNEISDANIWEQYLILESEEHTRTRNLLKKSQNETKKLEGQLAKKDLDTLGKLEAMKTKHREEKKRIRNDMNSDKAELLTRIKKLNAEHRGEIADKKLVIRDLKSTQTSQYNTCCNYAQAKTEMKATIQILQKDAVDNKRDKAKLENQVDTLTTQKNLALKKVDESLALKLKSNEAIAELSYKRECVALQRTMEAKSNGALDQQASLNQKQQMSVFNAELKVKAQKQAFEMKEAHRIQKLKEQRNRYANVSNAMAQNSPFHQNSAHSNLGTGGRAATLQNGGTFPNARVATTAHVSQVSAERSIVLSFPATSFDLTFVLLSNSIRSLGVCWNKTILYLLLSSRR